MDSEDNSVRGQPLHVERELLKTQFENLHITLLQLNQQLSAIEEQLCVLREDIGPPNG